MRETVLTDHKGAILIESDVRRLYQRFPYPSYPLWARLKWQDAFHLSSDFAQAIASHQLGEHLVSGVQSANILIAGCGDTLPYVIRHWEPFEYQVSALDFSRSSLNRAQHRLRFCRKTVNFIHADLKNVESCRLGEFSHVDCYGVLHHLKSPSEGMQIISQMMKSGATLRLMLYNKEARSWIYQLNRVFRLLKLDPFSRNDYRCALKLLRRLSRINRTMHERLVSSGILVRPLRARIVDTFFHPREARISISDYLAALKLNNIHICGLWDRYGELDDLKNPLLQPPTSDQLEMRASDRRFENNWELYCVKLDDLRDRSVRQEENQVNSLQIGHLRSVPPPRIWFSFDETRMIQNKVRSGIWKAHIETVYMNRPVCVDHTIAILPDSAIKRLARLGAILPSQVLSDRLRSLLLEPIHESMEPPDLSPIVDPRLHLPIRRLVSKILEQKSLLTYGRENQRYQLIMKRLQEAQR